MKENLRMGVNIFLILILISSVIYVFIPKRGLLIVDNNIKLLSMNSIPSLEKIENEQYLITEQINKSLSSTIAEKGELIVSYAMENDVDPYLAVAIILVETGCESNCSRLVRECNNVGGQHGKTKCGSGPYAKFATLDEGIKAFINNLSNNYIKKGLTTPELINTKYAVSETWAKKVTKKIEKIIDK